MPIVAEDIKEDMGVDVPTSVIYGEELSRTQNYFVWMHNTYMRTTHPRFPCLILRIAWDLR